MRISHRIGIIALMIVPLLGIGTMAAAEEYVVVPGVYASAEGNSANSYPFNRSENQRYQQVYSKGAFPSKKLLITHIAFRPNGTSVPRARAFSPTQFGDVTIKLSTTQAAPATGLYPDFDANFGSDVKVVYSGSLTLSSNYVGPAGGPKDFDIVIDLQTPFPYDPAQGNLLMYVNLKPSTPTVSFDAASDLESGSGTMGETSRLYDLSGTPVAEHSGLVTRFTVEPASFDIAVDADIKPGSEANRVNAKSRGTLPVAIYSTVEFDARSVDPRSVTVGNAPVKSKPNGEPMAAFEDANGDGLADLVVHVSTEDLMAALGVNAASEGGSGTIETTLEGKTLDGTSIKSTVSIRIVK